MEWKESSMPNLNGALGKPSLKLGYGWNNNRYMSQKLWDVITYLWPHVKYIVLVKRHLWVIIRNWVGTWSCVDWWYSWRIQVNTVMKITWRSAFKYTSERLKYKLKVHWANIGCTCSTMLAMNADASIIPQWYTDHDYHPYSMTRVYGFRYPQHTGRKSNIAMVTSSNGNIFRVTGHLCGEFTGRRWIPRTKTSDAELWCFFHLRLNKRSSKQSWGWWFETLSRPLWRHSNAIILLSCWILLQLPW